MKKSKSKSKLVGFTENKFGSIIFISWVVLIGCLIIKLLGFDVLELGSDNSLFNKVCDFIDNISWLEKGLACTFYVLSTLPIFCIIIDVRIKDLEKEELLAIVLIMVVTSLTSWNNVIVSTLLDCLIVIIIPIIKTKKVFRVLLCVALTLFFQTITIVIRDLSFDFNVSNCFLKQVLYQVDYYVMVLLFYLYNFSRKEGKK